MRVMEEERKGNLTCRGELETGQGLVWEGNRRKEEWKLNCRMREAESGCCLERCASRGKAQLVSMAAAKLKSTENSKGRDGNTFVR
jgi:hypothetical protein